MNLNSDLSALGLLTPTDLIAIITKLAMQLREQGAVEPILHLLSKSELISIINTLSARLAAGKSGLS